MSAITDSIQRGLTIESIQSYTEHGESITPPEGCDLYVVRYTRVVVQILAQIHPLAEEHCGGAYIKGLAAAKELISERFPEHERLLGIPDVVFVVPKQ